MSATRTSPPSALETVIAAALAGDAAADLARAVHSSQWWLDERAAIRRQAIEEVATRWEVAALGLLPGEPGVRSWIADWIRAVATRGPGHHDRATPP